MRMPIAMPARLARLDEPVYALAAARDGLAPQTFDLWDPRKIACAAACSRKAGFGACLARCLATGEACDGGVTNCERVA